MIISSFYVDNTGNPATGLTPVLLIYSLTGTSETLVVPSANMTEVGNGFYQYNFTTYDPTQEYVFRIDGGATLSNNVRWQAGSIQVATLTDTTQQSIATNVWSATSSSYTTTGTTGLLLNQIGANTVAIANNLYVNANSVLDIVNLIVKYDTNRTKIDPVAMTLTVYDDDCTTPLRTFQLLDTTGAPSITQVAERKPISAIDGLPHC